jgi:hypothetical protein
VVLVALSASRLIAPGTILGTGLPGGGAITSYMLIGIPAHQQLLPEQVLASSVSFGGQLLPSRV